MRHLSGGVCFRLVQSTLKTIDKAAGRHLGVRASVSSPLLCSGIFQISFLASDRQQNSLGRLESSIDSEATRSFR